MLYNERLTFAGRERQRDGGGGNEPGGGRFTHNTHHSSPSTRDKTTSWREFTATRGSRGPEFPQKPASLFRTQPGKPDKSTLISSQILPGLSTSGEVCV